MNTDLTLIPPSAELVRQSTDVAGLCKEIVLRTAIEIDRRKYVRVEGWQSIAVAHGCVPSARDVERVEGGYRSVGELRRMSDGQVIATAEGFVGEDEATWFGGVTLAWDKVLRKKVEKTLPKRADYAIRAMCQTRAVSRVCRTAFAHVVVLMDAGLSTTPAEEVPAGGFQDDIAHEKAPDKPIGTPVTPIPPQKQVQEAEIHPDLDEATPPDAEAYQVPQTGWRSHPVPKFIKRYYPGTLGQMEEKDILWWAGSYVPKEYRGAISPADIEFRKVLDQAKAELGQSDPF